MAATVIGPPSRLWGLLLPADRARVLDWTRRPRTYEPSRGPEQPPAPRPARLVSDMQREMRRAMRIRVWRDAGLLVGMGLAGAGVAAYVGPPVSLAFVGSALAWLLVLAAAARHVIGRARGRGVVGTAEGNAAYFADPERYAVGGLFGFSIGAGLGVVAMLAALVASM